MGMGPPGTGKCGDPIQGLCMPGLGPGRGVVAPGGTAPAGGGTACDPVGEVNGGQLGGHTGSSRLSLTPYSDADRYARS